ncbi:MAG: hypothetical protein HY543_01460 [Deltaproteobacteria bacterium]|nr:hypothetical protein [Deltaproteobacteria bacterium]
MWIGMGQAEAKTTNLPDTYPSLGQGIRPLGMGNAFLTMPGSDENALFYNPAALQDFEKSWRYSFMSPGASFNRKLITMLKDVINLSKDITNATTTSGKVDKFDTFVDSHSGEFHSVNLRLPLFSMLRKGWGIGLLVDSRTAFSLRGGQANRTFELRTRNDGAYVLGKSIGLMGDSLSVGVLVKAIYRVMLDRVVISSDIIGTTLTNLIGYKQWGKGFGVGADVGARYRLPIPVVNPVVAVTYQDIGNTRFRKAAIDNTPQTLNAGIGIHPKIGDFGLSVEGTLTQLNQRRDLITRLHAGAELRFPWMGPMRLSLRGGTNQGYAAGGFSLDFKRFRLDGAVYGEELGEFSRRGKNYRYAAELAFNF